MKINNLLIWSCLTLMLASCGSDDPAKKHFKTSFANHFAYSPELVTANAKYDESYKNMGEVAFDFDDDASSATVYIQQINLDGDTKLEFLTFKNLPMSKDSEGVRHIQIANLAKYGNVYPLQGLDIAYWPELRTDNERYHALYMRFTLANGRVYTVIPYESTGIGTTEVTGIVSGDKYVSTRTEYNVSFDRFTFTPILYVDKAKFADKMPDLNTMCFAGSTAQPLLPAITDTGYQLTCQKLAPSIDGIPYERYIVTNLDCQANLTKNEMVVKFYCAGMYAVEASVSAQYVPMPDETQFEL